MCQLAAKEYRRALQPTRCKTSGRCDGPGTCIGGYCLNVGAHGKAGPYVREKVADKLSEKFIQKPAVKALEKALVRVGVAVRTISKMKKLGGVASQLLASANLNNVYGQYAERRRLVNDIKILGSAIDGHLLDTWRQERV